MFDKPKGDVVVAMTITTHYGTRAWTNVVLKSEN